MGPTWDLEEDTLGTVSGRCVLLQVLYLVFVLTAHQLFIANLVSFKPNPKI